MKLKNIPLLLAVLLAHFSCRQKDEFHLPADKMQQVLFDVHLAEVYSIVVNQDSLHRGTDRNQDSLAAYYLSVFKHHKITPKQFEQSIDWYKHHPEDLDSIYTKMIPDMSKLDASYQN